MTFDEWWRALPKVWNTAERMLAFAAWQAAVERCAKMVEEWPGVMQYEEGKYCADIDEIAWGLREVDDAKV